MKTPVIIAARNEAELIGRTLNHLDARVVEPHVIANGCEDQTANVARSYGAVVYENADPGKLPAIQTVIKSLGDRALGPVLYTDADTLPISTSWWHWHMLNGLNPEASSATSGPIILDTWGISGLAYDTKYYFDTLVARRNNTTRFRGANMATHFKSLAVIKRILDLPHIWPGEDRAMELALLSEEGESRQIVHPAATLITSSRYVTPVADFAKEGRDGVRKKALAHYQDRAAEGSITLHRYLKKQKK